MILILLLQAFLIVDGGDQPKPAEFDFPAPTSFDPMQDCHYRGDCPGHSYQKVGWSNCQIEYGDGRPALSVDCVSAQVDGDIEAGYHRHASGEVHEETRAASLLPCPEVNLLVRGLIVDTARVSGGAFVDLWSTEYALGKCGGCEEGNPLGISPSARRLLKGAMVVGTVAALHKLRRDGHPTWAKWLGRGALAFQIGLAANNVRLAHQ